MKDSTQIEALQDRVREFCEARDWDQFHDIKELSIGVVTEAAELLELFRFRSAAEAASMWEDPKARGAIEDELADVFFFLLRIAGRYEVDLESALRNKIRKNGEKYPVEKSRGSNRKYTEF